MKVYFSASMTRYRKMLPLYISLTKIITDLGHEITSQHVVDPQITDGEWVKEYNPEKLWKREIDRLQNSDILISEVTTPSYGVAFMMEEALKQSMPLLSLYYALPFQMEELPLMLRGKPGINFQIYTEETARYTLKSFFDSVKK